jgi:hypothetical protein
MSAAAARGRYSYRAPIWSRIFFSAWAAFL